MLGNISVILLIALRIPKTLYEVNLNENKIAKQCRIFDMFVFKTM